MKVYKIWPGILLKETDQNGIFEVSGLGDGRTFLGRVYSSPLSALDVYGLESNPLKWRKRLMGKLSPGPIIGQRALIENMEGSPIIYTSEKIEEV